MQYTLAEKNNYCLFNYEDEVIANNIEGHSRWVAKLSNGENIYQDDFRTYDNFSDERRYSTWTRLRYYCYDNNLYIVGMLLQFRSNVQHLPENAEGYYFCKSILGSLASAKNWHFFVAGAVQNGILTVNRWRVPELIVTEQEVREIKKDDICLILKDR